MLPPDSLRLVEIHLVVAATAASEAVGWAATLRLDGMKKVLQGRYPDSGRRLGEIRSLTAALDALRFPCQVVVQADMPQLRQGIAGLAAWEKAGWLAATGNPVPAAAVWQDLRRAMSRHHVLFIWGPSSGPDCDAAEEAADAALAKYAQVMA